jgi:hypothetical protein
LRVLTTAIEMTECARKIIAFIWQRLHLSLLYFKLQLRYALV